MSWVFMARSHSRCFRFRSLPNRPPYRSAAEPVRAPGPAEKPAHHSAIVTSIGAWRKSGRLTSSRRRRAFQW
jgi:hypothetical protein